MFLCVIVEQVAFIFLNYWPESTQEALNFVVMVHICWFHSICISVTFKNLYKKKNKK